MDYVKPKVTVYDLELLDNKEPLSKAVCKCTASGARVSHEPDVDE